MKYVFKEKFSHFNAASLLLFTAVMVFCVPSHAQVSYFLPRADLEIVVTRTLARCQLDQTGNASIGVRINAEIKSAIRSDPSQSRSLDVSALRKWNKKGDLKLQLSPAGTLKSVNAEYSDRTGEIITGVLGGALKIAAISLGAPLGGFNIMALPGDDQPDQPCTVAARTALGDKEHHEKELSDFRKKLLVARSTLLAARVDTSEYDQATATVELLEKQISEHTALLNDLNGFLSSKVSYTVRPEDVKTDSFSMGFPGNLPGRWFSEKYAVLPGTLDLLRASGRLYGAICANACSTAEKVPEPRVEYRVPAAMNVRICRGDTCPDTPAHDTAAVLATSVISVPQFGNVRGLPLLSSSWFSDQTLKAEFGDEGGLLNFQYASNAAGEKAASTFSQSVDSILKYEDYKRKAPVEKVKQDTELLKALKEKADAEQALKDSQ